MKMSVKRIRKGFGNTIFEIINVVILTLFLVLTLYPVIYVLAVSLSDKLSVIQNKVILLPKGINLAAYIKIFEQPMFVRSYLNTVIYVTLGTLACKDRKSVV